MLSRHHIRAVRQSIFSGMVVFLISTVLFVSFRPSVFSQAANNGMQNYIPEPIPVFKLPSADNNIVVPKESVIEKSLQSARYIVKPQGLPIYKVTRVIDGGTVDLDEKTRVRLIGVKAPELDEEMGLESYDYLKGLLEEREVYLQIDTKNPKDLLDRTRGIIYLDKKNVNIEMLRLGFAHIYPTTPSIVGYSDWQDFEKEAREAKRGLWAGEKSTDNTKVEEKAIFTP